MRFAYEALRPDGKTIAEVIDAGDRSEAAESLRDKGLIVLRLDEGGAEKKRADALTAVFQSARVTTRDLILFTRQMKMLLEAGSALVPALDAAQEQTSKPLMRDIIGRLKTRVEEGDSLTEALESEGRHFDPVFRGMIAAGEATASLPQIFGRLSALAHQQQQARKMVQAALLYPMILGLMLVGVVAVLLLFVVPRFHALFTSLRSPLPATTKLLFGMSEWLTSGWPYVLAGVAAAVTLIVLCLKAPGPRAWIDEAVLSVPLIGKLASRLIFARVLRVWAAMLRCHVPLLEAIQQSRNAISNGVFLRLIEQVEESVSSGGRMAQALTDTRMADPVIVSAVRTGEDNGRLAESIDFVSSWLDEDNTNVVQSVTRLAEPVLLAFMGVIVGFVAMALFIPLFDLATAG
jgi:type II secretory pathway component PulF